jgi:gliding motility-associated-like protein
VLDTLCPVCDSTFVIVLPRAAVNLGADLTPCDTTIITLNAGAGTNMTYSWSTGETSQTILVPADGNYSVTIDNGGCSATDDINVAFYPTPILPAETILEICDAPNVTLDAENAGMTYNWSTGETTPTIVVDEAMSYTVLISSGPTCILDATYVVTRCNVDVLIANTMTPNGDGRNDTFIIEGIQNFPGTTLLVFNRDGVLLYESNNYNNDWDGDGLPATTYYYMIDLNLDGETYQGTINIIRE